MEQETPLDTGEYVPDKNIGSKTWQQRIRARARILAEQVETGYLELGEILYRIHDAPVDGDPNGPSVLAKWGYTSIGEFAERELSLHAKKAQRLVRIFYRVEVELGGFGDPLLKRRFVRLGWSKARELVRILTKENAEAWISKAEGVNYTTVMELVRREFQRQEEARINQALKKADDPVEASNRISRDEEEEAPEPKADDGGRVQPAPPAPKPISQRTSTAAYSEDPADKWISKVFQLNADQAETVNLALRRAQDLAGTVQKSKSSLLSLICLDFLSGADWRGGDLTSKLRFISKIERALGLKLVVVDDSNEVVYGLKALHAAASKMRQGEDGDE
jgi:hypothetical protein